MNSYYKDKNYYADKIKNLDPKQQEILNEQINIFFDDNLHTQNHYKIGDKVVLKANTLMHGVREKNNYIKVLKSIKEFGLISHTFVSNRTDWKINYCMSTWHLKKRTELLEYVKTYSGMTVRTPVNDNLRIPYGGFDKFIESLKHKNYKYLFAELSMEYTFMPNLVSDSKDKQLALIIFSQEKSYKKMLDNNLFSDKMSLNSAKMFFNHKAAELMDNRDQNDEYERIAYIPFGIPSRFIEGILVGRQIEKDKNLLQSIKEIFPSCYICNLNGVVIY